MELCEEVVDVMGGSAGGQAPAKPAGLEGTPKGIGNNPRGDGGRKEEASGDLAAKQATKSTRLEGRPQRPWLGGHSQATLGGLRIGA